MSQTPSPYPKYVRRLLTVARYRAKLRGIEFSLTLDDMVIPEVCPVFGIPLIPTIGSGERKAGTPSLDRRDNTKGYTSENARIISFKANQYKGDMAIADVEALLKYMKGNDIAL